MILALFVVFLMRIAFIETPEVTRIEISVKYGLKEKIGRVPDKVTLREQGGGKYIGMASFGAEVWDVTAIAKGLTAEWEAKPREAKTLAEIRARLESLILEKYPGITILILSLTPQGKDVYSGWMTAT